MHSNVHGSCNAIFSSSPINFNKENQPPEKIVLASFPNLLGDGRIDTKVEMNANNGQSPLTRSKSASTLQRNDSSQSLRSNNLLGTPSRINSKNSRVSGRTPVTHFCTPERPSASRNDNVHSKTPIKRYFSDHVLTQATPECFNVVTMETPKRKQETRLEEQTVCEGENSNLTVGVRVRPLSFKELSDSKIAMIVNVEGQSISVECESSEHMFTYDHCFMSYPDPETPGHANQQTIFDQMVLPLVQNAFQGYNVCLFAYGQTGSGKSHSMMGSGCSRTNSTALNAEAGIIPRFCHEIFVNSRKNCDTTSSVEISYFEIYNEKIHDLLASSSTCSTKRAPLKVREHPVYGPYIVDLSQHTVQTYGDLQSWLQVGNSQRATAATGMNEKSSRSHSIFSIILTQTPKGCTNESKAAEPSRRSKINLVDLAGSERLSQTCASGDRLREGVSINKSLLILGKVIASLAESTNNRKRGFVPYRESVLTWLLKCKGVEEDDEDFVAEEFAPVPKEYIPLWYKERAVALAAAHQKWSLKSLQGHGCSRLKHKQLLYRWKDDVKKGGTHIDKWKTIDRETYDRFLEARQNLEQESLGGNSRTAMLGTVSPGNIHMEETLATLRYASQARAIVNRVRINEDPHDKLIRELKAEVLRLRGVREGYERQLGAPLRSILSVEGLSNDYIEEADKKQREIELLRDKLKQAEEQLSLTQKSWSEKLHEAEARKDKELKFLRCCGIAVEIDFRDKGTQPCLVNLAADPMLSGALLYLVPPGRVRIGNLKDHRKERSRKGLDIVLDGPLVRQLHCTIENNNGRLTLTPEDNADTYLNGQIVNGKILLKHGDRLVIGGNHYFKVCNPHDDQSNKQITAQPVDFEFAHQEILTIQEEKLRAELEESKRKAMKELENAKREIEAQLGAQKCSFEREIQVLGTTLEKQKIALETTNQRKRELEIEKDLLAHEVKRNNLMRKIIPDDTRIQVTLYKSNFLQELEGILFETTADVEIALQMKLSDEAIKTGGVSLHEMQLLVREATERCRDVGVNYEFDQQQMIVDRSLQPCVRVRDRDRMLETHWPPMHFLDWIHRLRDHEIEDSIRELRNRDDDWEPWEDSEIVEDSLNNSRISINMTPVKRRLNESFHQLSDNSMIEGTVVNETTESTLEKRREDIVKCLEEMENAAKTLSRLCHQYESRETSGHVTTSLDKVRGIIDNLKHTLDGKTHKVSKDEDEISSHSAFDNTVIENAESGVSEINSNERNLRPDLRNSPSKLGIRDKCPFFKDLPNFKSVRFDVE